MWGRRKRRVVEPQQPAGPLREAMREARIEAAERTGVVVELRDAEIARLELLNEEIEPVFAEIPANVELFDRGLSRGDTPRLWIDAVAHVEMGRDKRLYRFVQDTRFGRQVLAESMASRDIVLAVTRYIARRLIDRDRALAGEDYSSRAVGRARRRSPRRALMFLLGVFVGVVGIALAAWIAASLAPAP